MSNPIIELKNFSFRYEGSDEVVLKNLELTINEGDFIGIVGCNRAGKSTLCKCMVGILPFVMGGQWDGSVIVDGRNFNETKGENISDTIGIVFQDAESQFTQPTVEDELAFAMCNFGFPKELIRERILYAAEACGLMELLDRSPFRLSGGQQQRLAVACILALQPRVLILDESTSQLDPVGRDDIFRLVGELHKQGKTVIMVDHNIEKIAECVDKVLVLHEGNLVAYDTPSKVFCQKELLNKNSVRIPQVTDAALVMKEQLKIEGELPVHLEEAIPVFQSIAEGV